MNDFILKLNGYLWGIPMIAFLCCTHIVMTVRSRFIQRKLFKGIALSVKSPEGQNGDISPFSALATSLASTIGTGNIIGVGTAVAMGGFGAVFWCWVSGLLSIATQYAEALLAVKYRVKNENGEYSGGPMYVLLNGLKSKPLAYFYASVAALTGLLTGAVIQSNAIGTVVSETLGDNKASLHILGTEVQVYSLTVGVAVAVLTALVIFGGIRAIGRVCEYMVPIMALLYLAGCLAVLFINRSLLAQSLVLIVTSAFTPRSALGGVVGYGFMYALRFGVSRGLLSNEAGLGTSSIVAAAANSVNPVRQGLVSMTATFWDTVVMCFITGLAVVSTVLSEGIDLSLSDGGTLCLLAFSRIGVIGRAVLTISMVSFAFSTILGWSCVGLKCAVFAFGGRAERIYLILWISAVLTAPLLSLELIWNVADLCNALLAVPNVLSLLMLSKEIRAETDKYINDLSREAQL